MIKFDRCETNFYEFFGLFLPPILIFNPLGARNAVYLWSLRSKSLENLSQNPDEIITESLRKNRN